MYRSHRRRVSQYYQYDYYDDSVSIYLSSASVFFHPNRAEQKE